MNIDTMPSLSAKVTNSDDADAPQGGEEHAPVVDMHGLSTLSAADSKRILEYRDPDLFGSGEFNPPAKSQTNTTPNESPLLDADDVDDDTDDKALTPENLFGILISTFYLLRH